MSARWGVVLEERVDRSLSIAAMAVVTVKVAANCTLIHGSMNQPTPVIPAIAAATITANPVASVVRYLTGSPVCGDTDVIRLAAPVE